MGGSVKKDIKLIIDNEDADHTAAEAGIKDELQRWPLFGLSVGSFLQVIAMERQTCIMEVYLNPSHFGHFCFVEGELYDAVCTDLEGEAAAMEMIGWENVRLNIKQVLNTKSVTRKIDKNLMLLLMESTRRRDEIMNGGEIDPEEAEDIDDLDDVEAVIDDEERVKFDACLGILSSEMGEALTAATISKIDEDKVLSVHQTTAETAKAFLRLTKFMKHAFETRTTVALGDHYVLDLKNRHLLVVLIIGEHQWCVMFNSAKCTLGLFRNVIMPKVIRAYNEMNL
jgi:hypothetical protein